MSNDNISSFPSQPDRM